MKQQLLEVDGVLVWVNPIQDEMNRTVLDEMLRETAEGEKAYVLHEINVSSVFPYPDSAIPYFVKNAVDRIQSFQKK